MRNVLVADIGASSMRAFLFNEIGQRRLLSRTTTPRSLLNGEPAWNVRLMGDWLSQTVRSALQQYSHIESVGVDCFALDIVPLDGAGRPTSDALSHRSEFRYRAGEEALSSHRRLTQLRQLTPAQLMPGLSRFAGPAHYALQPTAWERAESALFVGDYLLTRLGAPAETDYSTALASGLLDRAYTLPRRPWADHDGLAHIQIPELAKDAARGEVSGVPIVNVLGHDTASAFFAEQLEPTDVHLSLGTWGIVSRRTSPVSREDALPLDVGLECASNDSFRLCVNTLGMRVLNRVELAAKTRLPPKQVNHLDEQQLDIHLADISANLHIDAALDRAIDEIVEGQGSAGWSRARVAAVNTVSRDVAWAIERLRMAGDAMQRLVISGGGSLHEALMRALKSRMSVPIVLGDPEASSAGNARMQLRYLQLID